MIILVFTIFITMAVLVRDYFISGYKVILNPIFWTALISFFYLVIPSVFVDEINFYYNWGLKDYDIFIARCMSFLYMMFLCFLLSAFPSKKIRVNDISVQSPFALWFLWFFILNYLVYAVYNYYINGYFDNPFQYDGVQNDPLKLKNISYILVFITSYLFYSSKSYWVFIPNLIIVALDILMGSRTTALIALMPMAVSICVYRKTLYVTPALMVILGMSVLGVVRADGGDVPWYINSIGEFREVYVTLPLYISNSDYIGSAGFVTAMLGLLIGVLQPFRSMIMDNVTFSGLYIAEDIGRGYGLGSNLLIEGLYYGYWGLLITLIVFFFMLVLFYELIRKIQLHSAVILMSLFVIVVRLIVREGFYINFGLMLLILLVYWLPLYGLTKLSFFSYRYLNEK